MHDLSLLILKDTIHNTPYARKFQVWITKVRCSRIDAYMFFDEGNYVHANVSKQIETSQKVLR